MWKLYLPSKFTRRKKLSVRRKSNSKKKLLEKKNRNLNLNLLKKKKTFLLLTARFQDMLLTQKQRQRVLTILVSLTISHAGGHGQAGAR
ncbi:MAG: hypothetical protein C0390_07885 [Syntrophus sp. (in: bacteria)]|nr:hypothetical protein [Syntrophus sp. (in: bacteria)]